MDIIVSDLGPGKTRLDQYLHQQLAEMSRTRIQALIRDGHIRINGQTAKPNTPLKLGDAIFMEIPAPTPSEVIAQDIPLDVLYEDEDLIVINKAPGMVVHPAAGNPDGTLVNALLHHCHNLSGIGGELRPGIVHRLDKETSGCLVAAKHDLAHTRLTQSFTDRTIAKIYLAAVNGTPLATSGRIENRLGRHPVDRQRMAIVNSDSAGKESVTEWRWIAEHAGCALIECRLLTGRTHQIRVHMKEALHTPILGDSIYAQPQRQLLTPGRLMLHAWKLAFEHPISGKALAFEALVPGEFGPWMEANGSVPTEEKR